MPPRKPSLWRAWSAVVYQVAGVTLLCVGSAAFPPPLSWLSALAGVATWWHGFAHRPSL